MRTLKFIVEGQNVRPDPNCDFSGLVPGTSGYLQAEFSFSPEWNGCAKAAEFFSIMGKEYEPKLIKDGACNIPEEALARETFKIRVTGRKKDGFKIVTNKITIKQDGGKV